MRKIGKMRTMEEPGKADLVLERVLFIDSFCYFLLAFDSLSAYHLSHVGVFWSNTINCLNLIHNSVLVTVCQKLSQFQLSRESTCCTVSLLFAPWVTAGIGRTTARASAWLRPRWHSTLNS